MLFLFQQHASECDSKQNVYFKIWIIVKSTFSSYNYNFVKNFDFFQKSKKNTKINIAFYVFLNFFAYNVDIDIKWVKFDNDIDNLVILKQQSASQLSSETLILAYYFIISSWHKENLAIDKHISFLLSELKSACSLQLWSLFFFDASQLFINMISDFRYFFNIILKQ